MLTSHAYQKPKKPFPVKTLAWISGGLLVATLVVVAVIWVCKALTGSSGGGIVGEYIAAGNWSTYESSEAGYSISLPGRVRESRGPADAPNHPQMRQEDFFGVLRDGSLVHIFAYTHVPADWLPKYSRGTYGAHPHVQSSRFSMDGISGNEYRGKYLREDGAWRSVVARTFMVGDRLFDLSIENDATVRINEEHVERFFTSFKLTDPAQKVGSRSEYSETGSDTQSLTKPKSDRENYWEEKRRREAYVYIVAMEKNRQELVDRLSDAQGRSDAFYVEIARETLQKHDETVDERLEQLTGMTKAELAAVKREGESKGWFSRR